MHPRAPKCEIVSSFGAYKLGWKNFGVKKCYTKSSHSSVQICFGPVSLCTLRKYYERIKTSLQDMPYEGHINIISSYNKKDCKPIGPIYYDMCISKRKLLSRPLLKAFVPFCLRMATFSHFQQGLHLPQ